MKLEFWKNLFRNFANPRFLLCFGLAWLVTNGWSYIAFTVGTWMKWDLLQKIAGAYMALLWVPFTPEKIITFFIAIWLAKRLFPNDQKTLRELMESQKQLKESE